MRQPVVIGLFAVSLVTGTLADARLPSLSREIDGFHVLTGDFHVHSFPFSWATLSSWDTVIEAGYQGLDVIAMTPHNHTWVSALGRWFAERFGGPIVITSEEVAARGYHLIAVGITETISPHQAAASAIRDVHRQGGVAIAAHPYKDSWAAWDADALAVLDGAEIVRPEAVDSAERAAELQAFSQRASLAAIGSSDHHGPGPIGYTRTYVFARERTAQGVIDAIRAHRTVAFDRDRFYGDPSLVALATQSNLPKPIPEWPAPGLLKWLSRITAGLALVAAVLLTPRGGR